MFLSEINFFDFGRFWPILAIFLPFSQASKRINEMPQDQVTKGVYTNLKNSKMVEMFSNNPKLSYKVALVPPPVRTGSVPRPPPGALKDPVRAPQEG